MVQEHIVILSPMTQSTVDVFFLHDSFIVTKENKALGAGEMAQQAKASRPEYQSLIPRTQVVGKENWFVTVSSDLYVCHCINT